MVSMFHHGEDFLRRNFSKLLPTARFVRGRNITGPQKDEFELSELKDPTTQAVEEAANEVKEALNSRVEPQIEKIPFKRKDHSGKNSEEHYISEKQERPPEPKDASVNEHEKASSQPPSEVRENEAHKEANAKQQERTGKEGSSYSKTESHPSRDHVKSEELKPEAFKLNRQDKAFAVQVNLLQQVINKEKAAFDLKNRENARLLAKDNIHLSELEHTTIPTFFTDFISKLEDLKSCSPQDALSRAVSLFKSCGSDLTRYRSDYAALNRPCPFDFSAMSNQLETFRKKILPSLDSKN